MTRAKSFSWKVYWKYLFILSHNKEILLASRSIKMEKVRRNQMCSKMLERILPLGVITEKRYFWLGWLLKLFTFNTLEIIVEKWLHRSSGMRFSPKGQRRLVYQEKRPWKMRKNYRNWQKRSFRLGQSIVSPFRHLWTSQLAAWMLWVCQVGD